MSRILIYGINYAPELTGIGKYTGEMAEWLAQVGHEVRVITAPPYYPEWKIGSGYSGRRYQVERLAGVDVWRCPIWLPKKLSGLSRIVHLASFAMSSFPLLVAQLRWRPKFILCIEPPIACAPQALAIAKLVRARSWLHIQDFEVDAAFELKILPWEWMKHLLSGAEGILMRGFDRVSTISRAMMNRLQQKGVSVEQTLLFPNWVDTDVIFPNRTAASSFRAELGLPMEKTIALYSGNLGEKQGLDILINAAKHLQNESDLLFVICGEGASKQRLIALSQDLPNVRFLPLQPLERLNDLLNLADIHLLPQRADAADLVMPSKLTGILACGGAVVATAHPGTELATVVSEVGVTCPPGDAGSLANAIVALHRDPSVMEALRQRARKYSETHLSKVNILQAFNRSLIALCHPLYPHSVEALEG